MNKDGIATDFPESVILTLCDKTVNHEVTEDYALPDYQPEMRRVLNVSERVMYPSKYASGGEVECNGVIEYRVLYIGSDGGLYSVSFPSEYEFSVPADTSIPLNLSNGVETAVYTVCESTNARISAPRRVNVKSRLRSHVRSYCKGDVEEIAYGEVSHESVQKLVNKTDNSIVTVGDSDVIDVNDEISGLGDDVRVISADASVFVTDLRRSENMIDVSGDVMLKLLTCRDGEGVKPVLRKVKFGGNIDMPGMSGGSLCRAVGKVTDIAVNVDEGKIACDISLCLSGFAAENREWRYTADVYSTERECECEEMSLSVPYAVSCVNGNFSQSERLPLAESGVPEGCEVVDSWGRFIFDSCEVSNGKYLFGGESKYWLLCCKDGEYSVTELSLPVKYETEGSEGENITFDLCAEVISCRARVDGDVLSIDAEIATSVDAFASNNIKAVQNIRFGEPYAKQNSRMVVYYPAEGETSWDIAKKYHVPADTLTEAKNYYLF